MTKAQRERIEYMKSLGRYNKQLATEKKKLTKEHEEYLQRDIEEIYAALVVVLYDSGCDPDKIEELILEISREWNYHVENRNVTMTDYCAEHTGIDLRDIMYSEEE